MEGRSWQIAKKSVFLLVIKRRNGKPADGNGARAELFSVRSPDCRAGCPGIGAGRCGFFIRSGFRTCSADEETGRIHEKMLTEEEKNAGLEGRIVPINIEEQMKSAYIDLSLIHISEPTRH